MNNLTPTRQPVAYVTAISLIIAISARFGLNMTMDQAIAIWGALQVAGAAVIHQLVTPVATIPLIPEPVAHVPGPLPPMPAPAPPLPEAPVDPLVAVVSALRAQIEQRALDALTAAVAAQTPPVMDAPPIADGP